MNAYLVLENGKTFMGEFFGKVSDIVGEIVFSTGMNGFMEAVTDPSHSGQIVLQTFPLIGNSGIIPTDLESDAVSVSAYIVKYLCQEPSNFRSEGDLDTFFVEKGITGVKGIDTRALTKIIRNHGTMRAKITSHPPTATDQQEAKSHELKDAIAAVSCKMPSVLGSGERKIALLDIGVKKSTVDALLKRDCQVHIFPHSTAAEEILAINPQGILLSSGPEDLKATQIIETIKKLTAANVPIFGIGLGHLLLAMAYGHKVERLKHGHRGANQPVREIETGKLYITNQNHGYIVAGGTPSFVNVNDGTCEGVDYGNSFSVQFDPASGSQDTLFLFDRFIERMVAHAAR